jgi:hypothetical protein
MMMMMMMVVVVVVMMMMMMMMELRCSLNSPRLVEKRTLCLFTHNKVRFKMYPPQHTIKSKYTRISQ